IETSNPGRVDPEWPALLPPAVLRGHSHKSTSPQER
ncbi:unnamed protein product, partial [Allacma fusca]